MLFTYICALLLGSKGRQVFGPSDSSTSIEGEMVPTSRDKRRGECGVILGRDGRVVECGGLENRFSPIGGTGVRIPLSPQRFNNPANGGVVCFTEKPKKACFLKDLR